MAIRIIWDKQALENIANALEWISKESIPQAANVENAILEKIEELPNHPEKFKMYNEGSFRAFETHSFRITYKFNAKEIRILRIRHVRQSPKLY